MTHYQNRASLESILTQSRSLNSVNVFSEDFIAGYMHDGRMSVVRRFFCLFVTFDLIFISLLWIITIMITGDNIEHAIQTQIVHYTVKTSLFDLVMAAVCRFTVLVLFYGLLYIDHWIIIALTTSGSCAFLVAKVFVYNWTATPEPVFEVVLVLVSFVLAWGEAWFLDCRVIPQEKYAQNYYIAVSSTNIQRANVLGSYLHTVRNQPNNPHYPESSAANFYSPFESIHNSDDEGDENQNVFSYTTLLLIPRDEVKARSKNTNENVAKCNISSTHLNNSIPKTKASAINIEIESTKQNNINHTQNNDSNLIIKDDIEMNSSSESSSVDHISNLTNLTNLTNSGEKDNSIVNTDQVNVNKRDVSSDNLSNNISNCTNDLKENEFKVQVRNLNENIQKVSPDLNIPVTDSILHEQQARTSGTNVIPRSEIRLFIPNSIMNIKILSNDSHHPVTDLIIEAPQNGTDDIPRSEIRRIISDTIMNIKTLFIDPNLPVTAPISEARPNDTDDIPQSEMRRIFSNTIMSIKTLFMDPKLPDTEPISADSPSGTDDIPRSEVRRINSNTIMKMNPVSIDPISPVTDSLSHKPDACSSCKKALSRSEIKTIQNSVMKVKVVTMDHNLPITDSTLHKQEACSSGTNTLPQSETRSNIPDAIRKIKTVIIDPNLPVSKICSSSTSPSLSNSAIRNNRTPGVKTVTAKSSVTKLLIKKESVVLTISDGIPSRVYIVRGQPRRITDVSGRSRSHSSNVRPTSEHNIPRATRPSKTAIKSRRSNTNEAIWNEVLQKMGLDCVKRSYDILEKSEWTISKKTSMDDTIQYTKHPEIGKIYRLTGKVNYPAKKLLEEIYYNIEEMPKWNPTLLESRIVKTVDDHTDITYQASIGGGGGLIKPRDFVNLRCWQFCRNGQIVSNYELYPQTKAAKCNALKEVQAKERAKSKENDDESSSATEDDFFDDPETIKRLRDIKHRILEETRKDDHQSISKSYTDSSVNEAKVAQDTLSKSLGAKDFCTPGGSSDDESENSEAQCSSVNLLDVEVPNDGNIFLSAAVSIEIPNLGPTENYVRGENVVSCWGMREMSQDPNSCIFEWLLCIDLKGSVPRYLLEAAYTTLMQDYMKFLRSYILTLNKK